MQEIDTMASKHHGENGGAEESEHEQWSESVACLYTVPLFSPRHHLDVSFVATISSI